MFVDPRIRLPEELLASAAPSDVGTQSAPALAASVVLLRDGKCGVEAYLQIRASTMAFAGGRPAFPGGRIDDGDHEEIRGWVGPGPSEWARWLGVDDRNAGAIIVAAVRETFEESGYLLASPSDDTDLSDLTTDDWQKDRELLSEHKISLTDLLGSRRLRIRTDWLKPWSAWVTPEFEPRRFHTWFLMARCPQEQDVLGVSRESISSRWSTLSDALREADSGSLPLLPPQYCTFLELYGHRDCTSVFDTAREVSTVRPGLATDDDGTYLTLPDELVELGLATAEQMYPNPEGRS